MKKLIFLFFGCILLTSHSKAVNTFSSTTTTQCDAYLWYGNVYTNPGMYTHTSINSSGGIHTETLNLNLNYSTLDTANVTACNAYTWSNGLTYTMPGTYTLTFNNIFGCASTSILNLVLNNGVSISPKVFLYGAYDSTTGLMKDSLRAAVQLGDPNGIIPIPYLIPPHIPIFPTHFNPTNGSIIGQGVLSVSGPNAIVDWVYVELRDAQNMNVIISSKHALVQRDGDVVETNGITALYFPSVCPGNYYFSIKHRNHLGVMTANPISISAITQVVNFTTGSVWVKPGAPNLPRKLVQGVFTLIAGDANNNKNVKYNGSSNDKESVLNAVIGSIFPGYPYPPANNIVYGYRNEDVNMDGKVKFVNAENDKNFMLNMILGMSANSTPNDPLTQHTPN